MTIVLGLFAVFGIGFGLVALSLPNGFVSARRTTYRDLRASRRGLVYGSAPRASFGNTDPNLSGPRSCGARLLARSFRTREEKDGRQRSLAPYRPVCEPKRWRNKSSFVRSTTPRDYPSSSARRPFRDGSQWMASLSGHTNSLRSGAALESSLNVEWLEYERDVATPHERSTGRHRQCAPLVPDRW